MSKFVKRREYFQVICGTPYYVAPEVIDGKYSEHCDLWSLGVVMFVMLFGYPPFYAEQDDAIFALVKKGFSHDTKDGFGAHFPKSIPVSDSAKDLMFKLLNLDTARRITAAEALEHPWLIGTTASATPLVATVINNLATFSAGCKFKQAVLTMMTDSLTAEELQQLKKTFAAIDENGDGSITLAELRKAFAKNASEMKGITEGDLEKLMKMGDVDGDGKLSYNELLQASVNKKLAAKEERLWEAFCKLDINKDGKVTADELSKLLGGDVSKAKEMIKEVDVDGDGIVSFDEFVEVWYRQEAKRP